MRFAWTFLLLAVGIWAAGEDGGQHPDGGGGGDQGGQRPDGGGDDGRGGRPPRGGGQGYQDRDTAALLQVARVARNCHNAHIDVGTAVEQMLLCYDMQVDPAWLARVLATAEAGTAASSATSTSSEMQAPGGYQASWAPPAEATSSEATGSAGASGSAVASGGQAASSSGVGTAPVAADGTEEAGTLGVASVKSPVGGNVATGSSLFDSVPDSDDERLQARMRVDREQSEALDAVARASSVSLSRRVRIQSPGVRALQELDSRIRAAAGIDPDNAVCPICQSYARMPRYLPCGRCAHPADNPRGNVACLACLQKLFDKHVNGDLKCPFCRQAVERPADGDAFAGTEDALEHLTGVPLSSLVDMEAVRLQVQQPSCDSIVSQRRLRSSDATPAGSSMEKRQRRKEAEEDTKSAVAMSVASSSGARSAAVDAQRWMRLGFALADQLAQRANALRIREEQLDFAEERLPSTSAGPTSAQVTALLDQMPEEMRFPPELLDAVLLEAAGGVYVDVSDAACDFSGGDSAEGDGDQEVASEVGGGSSDVASQATRTPEPEASGDEAAEDSDYDVEAAERSDSSSVAALGPVPEAWLVAARSWHRAQKAFRKDDLAKKQKGFRCSCADCQSGGGRFRAKELRSHFRHYGRYAFGFQFGCPVGGCGSVLANREGFLQHLRSRHGLDTQGEDAAWLRQRLGRFQSTVRGPTRLDPFFRRGRGKMMIDEPLPPSEWRAYLESLRRPEASDGSGVGGRPEAEGSGGGGGNGRPEAEAEEPERATSAGRTAPPGASSGGSTEAGGAVAGGAAVLAGLAGAAKKEATKRRRKDVSEGDGALESSRATKLRLRRRRACELRRRRLCEQ